MEAAEKVGLPEPEVKPQVPRKRPGGSSQTATKRTKRSTSVRPAKTAGKAPVPLQDADDVQLIDPPPSAPSKLPSPRAQAIAQWLRTTQHGRFENASVVRSLRRNAPRASYTIDRLLRWISATAYLKGLGRTDFTAPEFGKNKKISSIAIGLFIARGDEWVQQAIQCQKFLVVHQESEKLVKYLAGLRERKATLGLASLLQELRDINSDSSSWEAVTEKQLVKVGAGTDLWDVGAAPDADDDDDDDDEAHQYWHDDVPHGTLTYVPGVEEGKESDDADDDD